MRWRLVARKDFGDAKRSKSLYVVGALFALVSLVIGYGYGSSTGGSGSETGFALLSLLLLVGLFFFPLVALFFSQNAVVSKRTSGEMKVLLGLPLSREAVILGSFVGRCAVALSILALYFGVAHVVALLYFAPVDPLLSLGVFTAVALFTVAFVGIATGISAAVSSTTRASVGSLGLFFLFALLWDAIPGVVQYVLNGFSATSPGRPAPEWAAIFRNLDPFTALRNLVVGTQPQFRGIFGLFGGLYPGSPEYYQEPVAGLVFLLLWLVVPLGLGYRRFRDADI
ncbi:ABC transporter permease [Haloarchaeobius sp. TZWWS8]|uniref:ABC transporter permease n=1 Tax=Haloarchaeobius sp. TZWWS8 TaxID=3446121 RepID=UPI003EC0954A